VSCRIGRLLADVVLLRQTQIEEGTPSSSG
jgi:hypothetical protein